MLSEILIHFSLKLKNTNSLKHLQPGTSSGVPCRLHEIINQGLYGDHISSLLLVAVSLCWGRYKGLNETQKNEHKYGGISEAWRLVCCCSSFKEKRILQFCVCFQDCVCILHSGILTWRLESLLRRNQHLSSLSKMK